ncbi:PREDICTED: transcription factor TFIIIB component B'' homolog [Fragaria vesca subsp. vesca]|uniref:transcription factor TFIIIB component B'' homolog n=1 Tax=Fragaria vesca subsp. vesca TaxID=101020 RepID=UPI0002C2F188|nr:PREDICTED: transcription factor TFIIIB component B'' homolog [Fragaria vesca subsp. vesca]
MDDLDFEPTGPVRVAGRFRPKAKPKSTKAASTSAVSDLPNVGKENSNPVSSTVSDTVPSATSVDVGVVNLTCLVGSSSEISGSLEPSGNNEHLCSSVPSFDGDGIAEPSTAAGDTPQPSIVVVPSNVSDGSHSIFGKSAGGNADKFSGLEGLDNFHAQTTSGTEPALTKSPDKVNEGNCSARTHFPVESSAVLACDVAEAQTVSDYCATQEPVSCTEAAMTNKHGEIRLETKEFQILDDVSDAPFTSGLRHHGKFPPKLRVKKGKNSPNIPHSEVGDMDESTLCAFLPGDVHDHISPTIGDSIAPNPSPNFQANAESLAEATQLDEAVSNGAAHSEGVCGRGHDSGNGKGSTASNCPQTRKYSASNREAKDGTSSRKSRKGLPHQEVDDLGNNTNEDSFNAENCSDFNGNEDREHNIERRKRAPRKSKISVSENEKPVQKRKRTKKAPDEPTEEPTEKKFSHSTRRNTRHAKKALLVIPEDEIDPQKVPLKDLIRLKEYRERVAIKEAAKLKASASHQSAYHEFQKDPSHNEEEDFGFEQDRSSGEDQAGYGDRVSTSSSSFNYQSFMNKERPSKWVQQDTELFYEGIEQFGSDFNMIAQLFPGRTRHQIKLKFKKEDRQNPLRITEAFRRHSKDNSKYVLVINELQKVAREKQESNADESNDLEELELTHDNDGGVTKPESDKIDDMKTDVAAEVQHDEADIAEVHSPTNSDQCDNGDGFGGWDDDF